MRTLFFKLLLLKLFETKFWNLFTIQKYMFNKAEIKRMNLLEDFTGLGWQMMSNFGVNHVIFVHVENQVLGLESLLHSSLLQSTRPLVELQ